MNPGKQEQVATLLIISHFVFVPHGLGWHCSSINNKSLSFCSSYMLVVQPLSMCQFVLCSLYHHHHRRHHRVNQLTWTRFYTMRLLLYHNYCVWAHQEFIIAFTRIMFCRLRVNYGRILLDSRPNIYRSFNGRKRFFVWQAMGVVGFRRRDDWLLALHLWHFLQ